MKAIEEAKRIIGDRPGTSNSDINVLKIMYEVPYWVLDDLIKRAELAGSVTPGPSARQIIRERIARLVGE